MWVPDILERYDPDSIRYFLIINAPENRDADFSWKEFIYSHNSELLGAYGNLVNRTFKFIVKAFDGIIPEKEITSKIQDTINCLYSEVGSCIESTSFKLGLEKIFDVVRFSNKYFDEQQPWKQINYDTESCKQTLADCVYLIANLAHILNPFLPFSSAKVRKMVNTTETKWEAFWVKSKRLSEVQPLFERIDTVRIEEELKRLNNQTI